MRKAQHKGKRVLASALCVGMLASMVPPQAFAAAEQPVAVEEAPAEEAALAPMDAPVEEALAAEETAAPAAQEAAAPQTAAARIATNVGVVPAGIDWADNVAANTFAEPYATGSRPRPTAPRSTPPFINGIRKPSLTPTRSTVTSSTTSIPIRTRPAAPMARSSNTLPTR